MDKSHMSMILPKVGDKLFRVMTRGTYDLGDVYKPEPCVVIYVNEKKGWYEVRFDNTNLKEGYHIPTFDHLLLKGKPVKGTPVACMETGDVYASISECAKDMRLERTKIWKQINGIRNGYSQYNFSTVL